jgi:hypothetical protein
MDATINEKDRFNSSIKNLKKIIKETLSFSNLVEEEIFISTNAIIVYLTLYKFLYRNFEFRKN